MTTPSNEIPVAVDYTSRDFYSLRDDLIARVQYNVNLPNSGVNWSGTDPSDFGVALVEAFAYMGDVVNYYIDRIANENYISTATQRQNIINLARVYGYTPSGYKSANCSVVFYNSGEVDVTVPAGTEVSGQVTFNDVVEEVIFTVQESVLVPAAVEGVPGQSTPVSAIHGEFASNVNGNDSVYGETVGFSSGLPNQTFMLSENQVVDGSIRVFVEVGNGSSYSEWKLVTHLADSTPTDIVYTVEVDADNYVYISFGDGVSGSIPTNGKTIKVNYLIGGGQIGNVTTNTLTNVYQTPTGTDVSNITVTNTTTGVGGSEPESNASIRYNAPKSLTTLNRAVTLMDYANLTLRVQNVGKSNAIAESKNSVTIYVAPQQNSDVTDLYPGFTGNPLDGGVLDTVTWGELQSSVVAYLVDKTQIGVSVTVAPPTYVPVQLLVQFTRQAQYTSENVKANILSALVNRFAYNYSIFEDIITPEEVEYQIRQAEGVYNAKVISLHRYGGSGRNVLQAAPNEIFVFDEANLDVNPASSNVTLTSLSTSVGTLSPVFSGSQLNYNLVVPDGTLSVDVTAELSSALITISGAPVDALSTVTVVTGVGLTTVPIVVIAQDGFTTRTYRIAITRNA